MRKFSQIRTMIAAVITGFDNNCVVTDDGVVVVGNDWLTHNNPVAGDYLVSRGAGNYTLVREADAEDWYEADTPTASVDDEYVVTNGTYWMNPKGGKTKKLKNAKVFTSESEAREKFLDGEMPDGFKIVVL